MSPSPTVPPLLVDKRKDPIKERRREKTAQTNPGGHFVVSARLNASLKTQVRRQKTPEKHRWF